MAWWNQISMETAGKPCEGPVFAKRQSSHMQIIKLPIVTYNS